MLTTTVRRRTATADDPFVRAMFLASRPELQLLPPELVAMQQHAQEQQRRQDHPHAAVEVLVVDGTDVGVLVTDTDDDAVTVVDITIDPAHCGHGICTAVLSELIAECREVRLHVWSENHGARRLYDRLGFTPTTDDTTGHLAMSARAESRSSDD